MSDITGQKFARLTAIAPTDERSPDRKVIWRFRCDCGKETKTIAKSAKSGNTQSCGCLRSITQIQLAQAARVDKVCPVCSKGFVSKLSHAVKTTYCSKACMSSAYRSRMKGAGNPNYKGPEHAERRAIQMKMQQKLWRDSNGDSVKEWNRNSRARRKKAEGTHTRADIDALLARQDGRCMACKCGLHGSGHVDHIIPLVRGGTNYVGNIQLLCSQCNLRKHAMLPIEYRARVLRGADEDAEQSRLMLWASISLERYPGLVFLHHAANGGYRTKTTAARMRLLGLKKGVPDLSLPVARRGYHGMYLEMKVGKNRPTPEQAAWIAALKDEGYYVVVAFGWEEAKDFIEWYLAP